MPAEPTGTAAKASPAKKAPVAEIRTPTARPVNSSAPPLPQAPSKSRKKTTDRAPGDEAIVLKRGEVTLADGESYDFFAEKKGRGGKGDVTYRASETNPIQASGRLGYLRMSPPAGDVDLEKVDIVPPGGSVYFRHVRAKKGYFYASRRVAGNPHIGYHIVFTVLRIDPAGIALRYAYGLEPPERPAEGQPAILNSGEATVKFGENYDFLAMKRVSSPGDFSFLLGSTAVGEDGAPKDAKIVAGNDRGFRDVTKLAANGELQKVVPPFYGYSENVPARKDHTYVALAPRGQERHHVIFTILRVDSTAVTVKYLFR